MSNTALNLYLVTYDILFHFGTIFLDTSNE